MLATVSPLPQYFGLDGKPLDAGEIYFGAVNDNPETNPITVYWDAAGTQPAAQPIRTINGYTVRSGTPATVYAATDYSVTVKDRKGRIVIYARTSQEFSSEARWAAFKDDLASTAAGDALVGVQRSDLPHAPALTLHKWIERGGANVRQCALPSNFNFATDDAWQYVQNLIADLEALGTGYRIVLDGVDTWRLSSQLLLNSDKNTGITVQDMPWLKYVGATMNTATQDNETGAFIYFSGVDHAFGGIDGPGVLGLDCQSKTVHGVYWAGSWNPGFKVRSLHLKHAQLDLLRHVNSGTAGPVGPVIDRVTMFPATAAVFGGVNASCGRYPIHLTLNSSTGQIIIADCGMDSGVSGCVGIDSVGLAGCDITLRGLRFENYKPNTDIIVTDYGSATSAGVLTVDHCKSAAASGSTSTGSIRSLVRNATSSGVRPLLRVRPLLSNDVMTDIYTHVADTTKSVTFDNKRLDADLLINTSATTGMIPVSAALAATPMQGDIAYDTANEQLILGAPTGGTGASTRRIRAGRSVLVGPAATPVTGADADTEKLFHNNNLASFTYNLPAISAVGTGWRSPVFSTRVAGIITLAPNGTDSIDTKAASATYASSNAAGNMVQLISGPGNTWMVCAIKGTWA